MKSTNLVCLFILLFVLGQSSCLLASPNDDGKGSAKGSPAGTMAHEIVETDAMANITGTQGGSNILGIVEFKENEDGLAVWGQLSNVPDAGKHGIHIHENGSCEDEGKAAGGHFNPAGVDHGFLPEDGSGAAHIGDMGNVKIDEEGNGKFHVFLPGVSLSSNENNVLGKTVILHAKEDDFGQPTGNAGGRIGCGIIEANK